MIPNIYEQSSDMRTMCRIIDAEAEILEYYTDHILDCYSPEHCPAHLVEELATHIGFKYNDLKTLMYNRVVLKNFIKHLIRYRGSATGIRNAAAIDIRYRQTHTYKVPNESDPDNPGTVTETVPMEYHESIDIDTAWVDSDADAGIIYLFIIAGNYFKQVTPDMSEAEKQAAYEDRMRKLLDFAYLQEYVRPVGMYLLPMVARKVDPYSDLTVKAVRIPNEELNHKNNAFGIPNASMEHAYDRMLFAKVENPNDELSIEPWVRTLYHSQLAGTLSNQYFNAPVFHIEGSFLYYDHSELLDVYKNVIESYGGTMGSVKLGDALYNPNRVNLSTPNYTYGDRINDEDESTGQVILPRYEPVTLQEADKALLTNWPLRYNDTVGFPLERVYQVDGTIAYPILTSPDDEYPIFLDVRTRSMGDTVELNTDDGYTLSGEDELILAISDSYMRTPYSVFENDVPTVSEYDGHDDGTNKNFIITLFDVDEEGKGTYVDEGGLSITGKSVKPSDVVPYDPATNGEPDGTDFRMRLHSPEDYEDELIP